MTIYKTEARIYTPKTVEDENKTSSQASQPLQECRDCTTTDCREQDCECPCDCEAQNDAAPRVIRRQSRPCNTWALAAICTVTIGLSFLLVGLLYMASRPEFRKRPTGFCAVMFPPERDINMSYPETIMVQEDEQIETFDIPQFNNNHHLTILADFQIQVTAFRDNEDDRCFLLNHSSSLFESPRNILEFMTDYKNGDHLTQLDTIYARMEIQGPALNITMMAATVRTHCFQMTTFMLHATEVVDIGAVVKRSVDSQYVPKRTFIFFNGKNRVHIDLDQ